MNLLEGFNKDYEGNILGQEGHAALNELFEWIMKREYNLGEKEINCVTTRENLTTIATTMIQRASKWEFKICCYNGVIYISNVKKNELLENEGDPKCSYAGKVFEDSRVEKGAGNPAYVIAKWKYKRINCLIAGKVNCKDMTQNEYIKIKTGTQSDFDIDIYIACLQAYLLGNQRVVYGLRDDAFNLEDVQDMKVKNILEAKEHKKSFDELLGFLYSVLVNIKEKVEEGTICTIWYDGEVDKQFYYIDGSGVFLNTEFKKRVIKVKTY